MKSKLAGVLLTIVVIAGGFGMWLYHMENLDEFYYAVVKNPEMKENSDNSLRYQYTMKAWSEKGREKELTFSTYDPLKEGQYLKLEVRASGVYHYDFISAQEVPEAAAEKMGI